jgi:hypothetical protein
MSRHHAFVPLSIHTLSCHADRSFSNRDLLPYTVAEKYMD